MTKLAAAAVLSALLLIAARAAQAQTVTVLYSFDSGANSPYSGLTSDGVGNFYGTTFYGGTGGIPGSGTVFELSPSGNGWDETTRYTFCSAPNCADGSGPVSNVLFDSMGNLYGTTAYGGANGAGVVFELSRRGARLTETVLYSFCSQSGCTDGANPKSGLIMDPAGNLYGTNSAGAFELGRSGGVWKEQVIYAGAVGGLTMDAAGNIFGATGSTVFELSPNGGGGWNPNVIHTFTGYPKDGSNLEGAPVPDNAGNLYGTTSSGGAHGYGMVYKLIPPTQPWQKGKWRESIVYSFGKCTSGACNPSGIVLDASGKIYGIVPSSDRLFNVGAVFELEIPNAKDWYQEKVLWTFNGTDGAYPNSSLILDSAGNLYGMTTAGGPSYGNCGAGGQCGYGVVFKVTP